MTTDLATLFEPLYRDGQTLTEAAFTPLTVVNDRPDWREFPIYVDMLRRGLHRGSRFTGLISPKFGLKTKKTGAEFLAFIAAHAGADVCLVNPVPQNAYLDYNVWTYGESWHPGITERAQDLLTAAGIGWRLAEQPDHGPNILCYANFWAGTAAFWDDYVGGVLAPLRGYLEASPGDAAARGVFEPTLHHGLPVPFLPFIVERLFSSYLALHPELAVAAWALPPEDYCFNEFERLLVAFTRPRVEQARRDGFDDATRELLDFVRAANKSYGKIYFPTD